MSIEESKVRVNLLRSAISASKGRVRCGQDTIKAATNSLKLEEANLAKYRADEKRIRRINIDELRGEKEKYYGMLCYELRMSGMSYEDIGKKVGVTANTVNVHSKKYYDDYIKTKWDR